MRGSALKAAGRGSLTAPAQRISCSPTARPRAALEAAGIRVVAENEVLVQRLKQDVPGQLGQLTRRMAEAGVNIEVLYSDHDHQMILVVDDITRGRAVSEAWIRETGL